MAVLALEGFRTEVLDGGCPAAQAPSALMPDTVILDIEMPLCDGFTVAAAMHESTEFAMAPIIACFNSSRYDAPRAGPPRQLFRAALQAAPFDRRLRLPLGCGLALSAGGVVVGAARRRNRLSATRRFLRSRTSTTRRISRVAARWTAACRLRILARYPDVSAPKVAAPAVAYKFAMRPCWRTFAMFSG